MTIEQIENIITKLQAEIDKNNGLINTYDERTRMAKVNQLEFKLTEILMFSMIPGFLLYGLFAILLKNGIILSIINAIPATVLSYPICGISLGIGEIIRKILERKWETKERLKRFSNAKTQSELFEEEIRNAIKLEQLRNRNEAIQEANDEFKREKTALSEMSTKMSQTFFGRFLQEERFTYNATQSELDAYSQRLEESHKSLDTLTTQSVLHEYFQKADVQTKIGKAMNTIVYGLLGGLTGMILLTLPDVMISQLLPATVSQTSIIPTLISVLAPVVVGTAGTVGYITKRNKYYTNVFQKLNRELGESALPEESRNFVDEQVKIVAALNDAKASVKFALVNTAKSQTIMGTCTPGIDAASTVSFTSIKPMYHGNDGEEPHPTLAREYPPRT